MSLTTSVPNKYLLYERGIKNGAGGRNGKLFAGCAQGARGYVPIFMHRLENYGVSRALLCVCYCSSMVNNGGECIVLLI